jgi:diguanylate cyclase (GGDEF)-like protein
MFQWQPYSLLFLSGVVVSLLTGFLAARQWRKVFTAPPFVMIMFAAAEWSLAETVATSLTSLTARSWWHLAIFPGVTLVSTGTFWIAFRMTDPTRHFRCRTWILLGIEPLLVTLLAVTNPWHRLLLSSMTQVGHPSMLQAKGGPALWAHSVYCYALIGSAVAVLCRHWRTASPLYRQQAKSFLIGLTFPVMINAFTLASMARHQQVDFTVLGFVAIGPVTWWAVRRQGTMRYSPLARGLVFDQVVDPLVVFDRRRHLLDLNPSAEQLLRAARPTLPGTLVGQHILRVLPLGMSAVASGTSGEITLDLGERTVTLDVRTSPLTSPRGVIIGHVIVCRDITALTQANRQLEDQLKVIEQLQHTLSEQAMRDALTGLHNRRYLMTTMTAELLRSRETGRPISLVMIDLDHFKNINDRHGHVTGDEVLRLTAQTLAAGTRTGDTIVRYGGEEFVVLLPGTAAETAAHVAGSWLRTCTDLRVPTPSGPVNVTFSAGVATFPVHGFTAEDLLRAADQALYRAKALGRNQIRIIHTDVADSTLTGHHT